MPPVSARERIILHSTQASEYLLFDTEHLSTTIFTPFGAEATTKYGWGRLFVIGPPPNMIHDSIAIPSSK